MNGNQYFLLPAPPPGDTTPRNVWGVPLGFGESAAAWHRARRLRDFKAGKLRHPAFVLSDRQVRAMEWARSYPKWRKQFGQDCAEFMANWPRRETLPSWVAFLFTCPFGREDWNQNVRIVRALLAVGVV